MRFRAANPNPNQEKVRTKLLAHLRNAFETMGQKKTQALGLGLGLE